jgi:WXG100 family type VII secretion target
VGKEISKSDQVLLDSAKDLEQTHDEVKGDLIRMRGQLDNLEAQWVGRGGQGFRAAITAWQGRSDKVLQALETFKANLKDVEAKYDVTEADVAQVFNRYSTLGD